jgi:hypothetical protein
MAISKAALKSKPNQVLEGDLISLQYPRANSVTRYGHQIELGSRPFTRLDAV